METNNPPVSASVPQEEPQEDRQPQMEQMDETSPESAEDAVLEAIKSTAKTLHIGDEAQVQSITGGQVSFGSTVHIHMDELLKMWSELSAKGESASHKKVEASELLEKTYRLEDATECGSLFSTKRGSRCLLYAYMLAFYGIVPITDAMWLIDALEQRLPSYETDEDAEKLRYTEAFLSQDTFLVPIRAKRSTVEMMDRHVGQHMVECVHLPQQAIVDLAMQNIWMMFPNLHGCFVEWLLHALKNGSPNICDQTRDQTIIVLSKVIQLDYRYGRDHIIKSLSDEKEMLYPLTNIMAYLLGAEQTHDATNRIVQEWMETPHPWRWKVSVLLYAWEYKGKYQGGVRRLLLRKLKRGNLSGEDVLKFIGEGAPKFIGELLPASGALRDQLASILRHLFDEDEGDREWVFYIYMLLLSAAMRRLWRKRKALPFLACDSKEQYDMLEPVHRHILLHNELWELWCQYIHEYILFLDKEFRKGDPHDKFLLERVEFFFRKLTYNDMFAERRVVLFLQRNTLRTSHTAGTIIQSIVK